MTVVLFLMLLPAGFVLGAFIRYGIDLLRLQGGKPPA